MYGGGLNAISAMGSPMAGQVGVGISRMSILIYSHDGICSTTPLSLSLFSLLRPSTIFDAFWGEISNLFCAVR